METARALAWIATKLKTDPTLLSLVPSIASRVYDRAAPQGTPYPLVRMDILSGGNDEEVFEGRVWSTPLVLVYAATDQQTTGAIEPIANRIDTLLESASGTVTNGVIAICIRERGFQIPDATVVPNVSRLGGEYRVYVSQA